MTALIIVFYSSNLTTGGASFLFVPLASSSKTLVTTPSVFDHLAIYFGTQTISAFAAVSIAYAATVTWKALRRTWAK
jgi:hypothetical protein